MILRDVNKMKKKYLITLILLIAVLALILSIDYLGNSGKDNISSEQNAMQLAQSSAKLIEEQGEDAFDLIRNNIDGDSYAFVWSMDSIRLVFPPNPEKEGESVAGLTDAEGTSLEDLFIGAAKNGGGWVEYVYPKPGETESVSKRSYVMPAVYEGKTYVVVSGYYLE